MKTSLYLLPFSLLITPYLQTREDFTLPEKATIVKKTTVKLAHTAGHKIKDEVLKAEVNMEANAERARGKAIILKEDLKEGAHNIKSSIQHGATRVAESVKQGAHNVKATVKTAIGESMIETAQETASKEHARAQELQQHKVILQQKIANLENKLNQAHQELKTANLATKRARCVAIPA